MPLTGIARKIDQLGRVVVPSEIRKALDLADGDLMSISVDGRQIVLEKVEASCVFCRSVDDLREFAGRSVCARCMAQIADASAAAS